MEHEIAKHTKKIYKIWKKPASPLKKLGEIAVEILIIVFAVSLAAYLERQREHSLKNDEAKEFVLGLKGDLEGTIASAKDDIKFLDTCKLWYTYLSSLKQGVKPNTDSLNKTFSKISFNNDVQLNESRYSGFKSSGKLEQIENKELLKNIINFYENDINAYRGSTSAWRNRQNQLINFITDNAPGTEDSTADNFKVITMPKARLLAKQLIPWQQLYDRDQAIIEDAQEIIEEIKKEY